MSYRSETISTAVSRLNREYFLPAIQREYVWKPDQIVQLFDSILRGYPISSFLFWDVKPGNRENWEIYKFIDDYKAGGVHNARANVHGTQNCILVLDGQQRLTSLLIGLKGSYAIRKQGRQKKVPDRYALYLNLLTDPESENNNPESGVYYGFAFQKKGKEPPKDEDNYWFPISKILDFDEEKKLEDHIDQVLEEDLPRITRSRPTIRLFEKNIKRLYEAVHKDEVIAYYTEHDQDYDRVLDIFVRANEGGTKLSKSDLLLSMITLNWNDINARDEIYDFVDYINTQLARHNSFDKDFIMKSCLVLCDLPVVYKVQNFNVSNLNIIKRNWAKIKKSIERGVDMVNSFGIDEYNLTSVNALIPIIYYIHQNPEKTFMGSSVYEIDNRRIIKSWLIMALLMGAFGRASDGLLHSIRDVIRSSGLGGDFPFVEIIREFSKTGLSTEYDAIYQEVLSKTYGQKQAFLALTLLYDDCHWGSTMPHIDHLFPQSSFKTMTTTEKRYMNSLGNLCLMTPQENLSRQDMPLEDWLATRGHDFVHRHLIPNDNELWKFEKHIEFIEARERLIKNKIKILFDIKGAPV